MNIVAFSLTQSPDSTTISNGVGNRITSSDPAALLDFLVYSCPSQQPTVHRAMADLDHAVSCIARNFPDSIFAKLRDCKSAQWSGWRLFYIPEKLFSVRPDTRGSREVVFYDLSQYYPDEDIRDLPVSDLQHRAEQLLSVLSDLGVPYHPQLSLASPLAALRSHPVFSELRSLIPTIFDQPEILDAHDIAYQCTPREWISNFQIGHFPELYTYDLSSAYAYHASQLLDLRDCDFIRYTRDRDLDRAYYGFLIGNITVYPESPHSWCSPFLHNGSEFTGTIPDYPLLLDEVRILYRYGLGNLVAKSGWLITPKSGVTPRYPFKALMESLYTKRQNGDTGEVAELRSYLVKRVMTGVVGKLLETRRDGSGNVLEYGNLFNPIYHSICTTRTRLQVFEFIIQNRLSREDLVHIGVDGFRSTCQLSLPTESPMGKWRLSKCEPSFVFSPGGIASPSRKYKRSDYADLYVDCLSRPRVRKVGLNRDIDLGLLWLNQTRRFERLPKNAQDLMDGQFLSSPVRY